MKRELQLSIALTPNVEHDIESDTYVIYYEQFPQAIASGTTIEEAEVNLIHILELMFKERKQELKEMLVQNLNDTQKSYFGINKVEA